MSKQLYKSLYFNDFPSSDCKDKTITIAFSESESMEFDLVKDLSTAEIKDLVGIHSYRKLNQLAVKEDRSLNQIIKRLIKRNLLRSKDIDQKKHVTFFSSKEIPFQRWYPYIEGYSPVFVRNLLDEFRISKGFIYEPFAGTGTTIFASDSKNIPTIFSEVNPLLQYIIEAKINALKLDKKRRIELAKRLRKLSESILSDITQLKKDAELETSYKVVFGKSDYFPKETFNTLLKIRTFIDMLQSECSMDAQLLTVAVLSNLLSISYLKKAGDVRFKTEKEIQTELKKVADVIPQKLIEIAEDIENLDYQLLTNPKMIVSNAKDIGTVKKFNISSIITSPPYLNGTNYFRNTKIELWFLRYLTSEYDLRQFRNQVLTSGINDVSKDNVLQFDARIMDQSNLLKNTVKDLDLTAYDKRIPVMAKSYFQEMYLLFRDVRKHLLPNSTILIDIGDSIFAGTHIKTDLILVELLQKLGYNFVENRLLRKRRSRDQTVLSQNLLILKWPNLDKNEQ